MQSFQTSPAPAWACAFAGSLAAAVCGAPRSGLSGRNRARRFARARRLALHLSHVGLGATLTSASAAIARDRSAARRACARLEDSRDRLAWDRALDGLERALRLWCSGFSQEVGACAQGVCASGGRGQ